MHEETNVTNEEMTPEQQAQFQADMEAGFDAEVSGVELPPAEESEAAPAELEGTSEAPADEQPNQEGSEQPSAEPTMSSDDVQALLGLADRVRNLEGRSGDLKDGLEKLTAAKADVEASGSEAPSDFEIKSALDGDSDFEELAEDYPEWAATFKKLDEQHVAAMQALERRTRSGSVDDGQLEKLREEDAQARASDMHRLRVDMLVESKHPKWGDTVGSEEFKTWRKAQPKEVEALAKSPDPYDAITMLDKYESSRAAAAAEEDAKTNRLEGAVMPTQGRSPQPPVSKSEQQAFEEGYASG